MSADSDSIDEVQTCATCGALYSPLENSGGCVSCSVRFALAADFEEIDDSVEDAALDLATTRQYGHFEIVVSESGEPIELGHGAMGTTYRGWDSVLHTPVALKVINISVADHPEARIRFIREARAAAQLRHPNIASVFHYGEQDGDCFYAMELVEGETLETRVLREGPLSVYLALEIVAQVAQALAAAEAQGIVHRDLKPSNLMLVGYPGLQSTEETPVVKVIDFGLAKVVSKLHEDRDAMDTRILFVGTPAFASPEQYSKPPGARIDTRSDIYSLGVTLWYLLCGRVPFVGTGLDELEDKQRNRPLPLGQLTRAGVPRRVVGLLKSLLAVDPALRPQSARELVGLVRKCQDNFPLLASERKRRRRGQLLVGAFSLAICAAAAIGIYLARPPVIPPDRSIAVLPFKNLNPEKADAFFTTAIQYGMAANLAQIPSFKVVGPESTTGDTSKDLDYRAIGQRLGVRYLLEGSVRRDGEQVQVTIRLNDLDNLARPLTSQYEVPISEALAYQNDNRRAPEIVHDPSSLLAFLLPVKAGSLGSLAAEAGASVPFTEYEAESGALSGGASVISLTSPPTSQSSSPQLEASGRAFVQLAGQNQSVSWTNNTDRNITAINIRYSIPDAPNGGGLNETLNLYVNGIFRQTLPLSSAQTWVYQDAVWRNGMAQAPAAGLYPHVFFDEMHAWVQGEPIAPGSTIMLKEDASNTASFYDIDLIDLESPPDPLPKPADFLSVDDFGARANDPNFDNTSALKQCLAAAEGQKKGVWIPKGIYYLTAAKEDLVANGITIEGAGPWYSTIYHQPPLPSDATIILHGSSCTIRNLAFDSNAVAGVGSGGSCTAIDMIGSGWVLDNIWSQHEQLIHARSLAGTVENCRINNSWTAAIAIQNWPPDFAKTDEALDLHNNFCRGNVGRGIFLEAYSKYPPFHNPKILNNTLVGSMWGPNLQLGGASGVLVENNLLRDPVTDANLIVSVWRNGGQADVHSATVRGNVLVRGGASKIRFLTASLVIGDLPGKDELEPANVSNVDVVSNTISDSLFSGITLGSSFNTVLQNNIISSPGGAGIEVLRQGPVIFAGNEIKGTPFGEESILTTPGARSFSVPIAAASYNGVSSDVSCEPCAEGGRDVAHFKNGAYTLYHGIDLADVTTFVVRAASESEGGSVELRLDDPKGPLIGSAAIPNTGGWAEWKTFSCPVPPTQGIHDIYLVGAGGSGELFNLEWLSFSVEPPVTLASNYSSVFGNAKAELSWESNTDLGHIDNGNYTSYRNIDLTGRGTFYARVASRGFGGKIDLRLDSPTGPLVGTCLVPPTEEKWKTVSCDLTKTSGAHELFLVYSGPNAINMFAFEWFGFEMPDLPFISAVRMNSASPDIRSETCSEGGQDLSFVANGDYVAYNDINVTGMTSFTARMASATHIGGSLDIHLDSPTGPLIGSCKVPITGWWQSWKNHSCDIIPTEGFHNLFLVYNNPESGNTFRLKSFQVSPPNLAESF